jgi:hypothetical protein
MKQPFLFLINNVTTQDPDIFQKLLATARIAEKGF